MRAITTVVRVLAALAYQWQCARCNGWFEDSSPMINSQGQQVCNVCSMLR